MNETYECIPNYSVGEDEETIERIAGCFDKEEGVNLVDYSADRDHNRLVITAIGSPEGLIDSCLKSVRVAVEKIDMNEHEGGHPRMGAVDVIPFVPVKNATMDQAVEVARSLGEKVGGQFNIPVYLYEKAATAPGRKNLADIRRGEFEGFFDKISRDEWTPDFGPNKVHPTAGVTAIGARKPLIAFNVNLRTDDLAIAKKISRRVRHSSGGFRYCKAMAVELEEDNLSQVSMNMTDYTRTPLHLVYELIKSEADRYGVEVAESEIIGVTPAETLLAAARRYLQLNQFSSDQVIENRLLEDL